MKVVVGSSFGDMGVRRRVRRARFAVGLEEVEGEAGLDLGLECLWRRALVVAPEASMNSRLVATEAIAGSCGPVLARKTLWRARWL